MNTDGHGSRQKKERVAEKVFLPSLGARRSNLVSLNQDLQDCRVAKIAPRNDKAGLFQQPAITFSCNYS
jgi:hypothetical protein